MLPPFRPSISSPSPCHSTACTSSPKSQGHGSLRLQASQARPLPDLRDAHTSIRLPAQRDFVQPYSRIQARAKSVAAPLICADARNIEVLTDFQPVNTLGNLGVLARLLNSRTEIRVSQRDAVFVAA